MRKLFKIALQGASTFEVESLASYIHRSAFSHGVQVGQLLNFAFEQVAASGERNIGFPALPAHFDISQAVRPNRLAYALAHHFELLTNQRLMMGTFLKLESAVGRTRSLVRFGFCWCPECFAEDLQFCRPSYIRLIWHLTELTHCPLHRTPLATSCEFCGCDQTSYLRRAPIHICQRCDASLASRRFPLRFYDLAKSWMSHAEDLLQLVADLAKSSEEDFLQGGLIRSLKKLLSIYSREGEIEKFYALLSKRELERIMFEGYPVSLAPVRRIAFQLGVPISALLNAEIAQTTALLDFDWKAKLPSALRVRRKAPPRDHPIFLKRLNDLLDLVEPICLREVARRLEVSVGYLEYRYPAAVKQVSLRYREYRKEQKRRKQEQAGAAAHAFFNAPEFESHPKSRKEAYRILHSKTNLPKFVLRGAIQQEYLKSNIST